MRRAWMVSGALVGAVVLSVALFATASGRRPPEPPGAHNGVPASIQLTPDPIAIQCDGVDASTVTVRVTDSRGRAVPDGTEVFFDAVYGFVDPVIAETNRGEASTQAHLYPFAGNFLGQTQVDLTVGPLRASIGIDCLPPAPPCGPDASPPCPTPVPCNAPFSPPMPFSPPCEPPLPCSDTQSPPIGPSPPCPTPTPDPSCYPQSPPCDPTPFATPTFGPSVCTKTSGATPTPTTGEAEYRLTARTGFVDGTVIVTVGVGDAGDPDFEFVQWHLCYDPDVVSLKSIEPVGDVAFFCDDGADNGARILMSCADPDGSLRANKGYFLVRFECTDTAFAQFSVLRHGPERSYVLRDGAEATFDAAESGTTCRSLPAPTPTPCGPSPCTPTPTPVPAGTGTIEFESFEAVSAPVGQRLTFGIEVVEASIPYSGYQFLLATPEFLGGFVEQINAAHPFTLCAQAGNVGLGSPAYYGGCLLPDVGETAYLGQLTAFSFVCLAPGVGEVRLNANDPSFRTSLFFGGGREFGGPDPRALTVFCGDGLPPTATATPPPTMTATPTPTPAGGLRPFILP